MWKAHDNTILRLDHWHSSSDRIITHGRDHRLKVWQLRLEDEDALSKVLPADDVDGFGKGAEREGISKQRRMPWLLHSIEVNALNFCGFASCTAPVSAITTVPIKPPDLISSEQSDKAMDQSVASLDESQSAQNDIRNILLAVPGIREGDILIHTLPSEKIVAAIPADAAAKTGMLMALSLTVTNNTVTVIAGYENGAVAILTQAGKVFERISITKAHSQPVLSLDVSPSGEWAFSCGADATVVRYSLHDEVQSEERVKVIKTKHAGQQNLNVRSDGRIFATAGWDGRIRVYTTGSMTELAVLKWHKEGCYALAFAEVLDDDDDEASGSQTQNTNDDDDNNNNKRMMIKTEKTVSTVRQRRLNKAQSTHMIAAGSKDAKISLWEIY